MPHAPDNHRARRPERFASRKCGFPSHKAELCCDCQAAVSAWSRRHRCRSRRILVCRQPARPAVGRQFRIPLAKRISSCEFLSNCSLCNIGGRSFSWISTTMSAHWLASRERRATSLYSLVIGLTLPRTVAMRDFPNNDSTPPKSTNQSELRWPFVLTAVNAAHKIKAAERFRSIKIAPSFNGRTADSGSAYPGSNPWGAANLESTAYDLRFPPKQPTGNTNR